MVMAAVVTIALDLLVSVVALAVLLVSAVLFVEVMAAILRRDSREVEQGGRGSVAVLMPAHNESLLIASTIRSIVPQLLERDRLLVVADNCSDDTAAIAAAEGAEVVVRTDPEHRGKGYALAAGVDHFRAAPPDVVLIVDADIQVSDGTVERLVRACGASGRPVQALYLMRAAPDAPAPMRLAEFAWLVKNQVRPEGLKRLGLPCQLTGSGMAFPWSVLCKANLATGHIVEDLKLGLELARNGSAPILCRDALITSEFPNSSTGVKTQRTRWEHGHLSVMTRDAPGLLLQALKARNWELLALTADLCVPPTALLVLLGGLSWVCGILLFLGTGFIGALAAASVAVALIAASVLGAWLLYARRLLPLSDLMRCGIYALRKVPLYARFLVAAQTDWVRSRRE
jgi:cellulose synthase/poly-beta-1,6-N-acetylglucosamine synthase-like glycosyltransferase